MTIAHANAQAVAAEPAPIHALLTLEQFEKACDEAIALAVSGRAAPSEACADEEDIITIAEDHPEESPVLDSSVEMIREEEEANTGVHLPANWQAWAACAAMVLLVVALGYGVMNFPA